MHNTIKIPSIFPSSNFGKLKRRVVAYAPADPPFLEVEARLGATKLKFIVDSGTSVSIAPSHYLNVIVLDPTTVTLSSATRNSIPCLGQAKLQIQIPKFRRAFLWTFKVAETVHPLLGFDFINNFGLIIDCKNKQLRDTTTDLTVNVQFSPSSLNVVINKIEIPTIVEDVIKDYPSLTSPHVNHDAPYNDVYHRIETSSHPPVYSKAQQLSEEKHKAASEHFRLLQGTGIISPSQSKWSSTLHLVPKENGE
ncbi:UNVERIFIED_CONTAM: hypothetical protein GTU68_050092 [Idotea baltica]|nr:hypothetical protein [Idotea baltica]